MKKHNKYIGMLLVLFAMTITATYGQQGTEVPRLAPDEQAAFEKTVPVNPAKLPAGNLADSKMVPMPGQPEPARWKIAENPDVTLLPEEEQPEVQPVFKPAMLNADNTQQPGAPAGKTVNLRDLKGSKTQPDAPAPSNNLSRRNVNGPKVQPEGKKPER